MSFIPEIARSIGWLWWTWGINDPIHRLWEGIGYADPAGVKMPACHLAKIARGG